MKNKIGVYICQCGGNISDCVDVEKVKTEIENEQGVVIAKTTMFACADSAQKEIINDIKENNLDAIVVASCSPKLHLFTFRNVAERAGLNQYNYVQVNLREQCSWAHSDRPKEATKKAVVLVKDGIARVRQSEALKQIKVPALNIVTIVGAGVSGMRAAIELADMGTNIYLIEKDYFVGGRIPQIGKLFETNEDGKEIIKTLYYEIKKRKKIRLFTGAEIKSLSGSVGNFEMKIAIKPRYIKLNYDKNNIKKAIQECNDETPDTFNFELTKRKAIYKNYETALPDIPVIDKDLLTVNKEFLGTYKDCIDINQKTEILNINTGAILLCSGFDSYEPKEGEYGYKKIKNVIKLQQFERIIELNSSTLTYKDKKIKNIAFIYCVGSRQIDGENKYCSRFCCTAAIHSSLTVKEKFKDIKSFHLYRDIRTYGKYEILYEDARRQGDIFIKFDENEPPLVEEIKETTHVKCKDLLYNRKELDLNPDLVVLITGMVPRKDSNLISSIIKTPLGRDNFFNEVHPKLRPVETVIDGVFISGTCQGPKNISESIKSSLSASVKANFLLNNEELKLEPIIANIDPDICEWCGKCIEVCTYNTITKVKYKGKFIAKINITTCKGCGMCATICPENAIDIIGYSDKEIEAMIDVPTD
ncbi:MAG: CoB--CoM heterodisulfide reductase iron-sulfur subunit A family protein [Bacteroidales bacterium]|nr:CoB--CoM heterodisulfide reductase iron-sulfur subunit A family protein [Bacteroidales bacterium]